MNNRHLLAAVLSAFPLIVSANDKQTQQSQLLGGATTVFDKSHNAFSLPARNLRMTQRGKFFVGNAFFKQPWIFAPSPTTVRDGLGPLFNSDTCQGCHVKDGRGKPPTTPEDRFLSTLVRLSIPAKTTADKATVLKYGVVPEPSYGEQLQPKGTPGIKGEASPSVSFTTIKGHFKDGEPYSLIKPVLSLSGLNYGELHPEAMTSIRVAPAMSGLGLLGAIPEKTILLSADPDDKNNDGISGRPNRVWDVKQQKTVLGRFGWKANQPTVEQQTAAAFHGDMGLTSPLFPKPPCSPNQKGCLTAIHGGDPEVSAEILATVVFYSSTLGVPARRNIKNKTAQAGERIFNEIGCSRCHLPEIKTGKVELPELSNQTIRPYTDLLLHDMGDGLADGRPDFLATGKEWRTPPLWGIGLVESINKHTRFLHDGRARNLMEAVLWHGGEAEQSKQAVLGLNKNQRDALIAFLQSL